MFLEKVATLGLLSPDENSNIIGNFALPVKRAIVSQIVTYLTESATKNLLTTQSHVIWTMEVVGQGFSLPIEVYKLFDFNYKDDVIIMACVEVYRRWMQEPTHQPKPIVDDTKQYFLQKIFQHFSLLFQPRKYPDKEQLDRHVKLCQRALQIMIQVVRTQGKKFVTELWEVILKLLMGITDQLLNANPPDDQLGHAIQKETVKVLFETWLLSHTLNVQLWNTLKDLIVKNWSGWIAVVNQWTAVCNGLTNRMLALLYGPSEGTANVVLKFPDDTTFIELSNEYVFYAWQRCLRNLFPPKFLTKKELLGNPNNLSDPRIFFEFIKGTGSIVHAFLNIGKSGKKSSPPDGNTILHIFGSWLFEAVKAARPKYINRFFKRLIGSFDDGTAMAIEILNSIFRYRRFTTKFEPIYLASYYSCLSDALLKEGKLSISCIQTTTHFLTYDLEGSRTLVPYFLYAISQILTKPKTTADANVSDHLRKCCIKILSTMISFANFFGKTQLTMKLPKEYQTKLEASLQAEVSKEGQKPKPLPEITTYSAMKPHVTQLLLKSLKIETNPENTESLLWSSLAVMYEMTDDTSSGSDFHHLIIDLILSKLSSHAWNQNVMTSAFKVLSAMTNFFTSIPNSSEEARILVNSLSKYISTQLTEADDKDDKIVIGCYHCITDWIMADTWLLKNGATLNNILYSITLGLGINIPENKRNTVQYVKVNMNEEVKEAAQYCLLNLLNNTANFPTQSGARKISSLVSEGELLAAIAAADNSADIKQFCRFFMIDSSTILTVVDNPYTPGAPTSTFIIRNRSGRFAWNAQLIYLPTSEKPQTPVQFPKSPVVTQPFVPKPVGRKLDDSHYKDLITFLDRNKKTDNIIDIATKHVANEESFLKSKKYGLNCEIAVCAPTTTAVANYSGDGKFNISRIFMSHMGYLSLENKGRLFPLEQSGAVLSAIKSLDNQPERFTQKIGVIYISDGQKTETEILANQGGSLDYQEFLSGLGWGIHVANHPGYLGNLDPFKTGELAPYFANYSTEIIFHAATLIPTFSGDTEQLHKKNLITKDLVLVAWIEEELDDCFDQFDSVLKNDVQIVVHPLSNGLFQIRVRDVSSKERNLGTVLDNFVVRKESLSAFVRTIAMFSHQKAEASSKEGIIKPYVVRQKIIDDISKYKKDEPLDQFYSNLFLPLADSNQSGSSFGKPLRAYTGVTNTPPRSSPQTKVGNVRQAAVKQ